MSKYTKWVAAWGNATSIIDQKECTYSKNITLRYPCYIPFNGSALRLHFSNLTGVEPITLTKVTVADTTSDRTIDSGSLTRVTFKGNDSVTINPGEEITSDEITYSVTSGNAVSVSIYLQDYTNMNAGVLITGPLSKGVCAFGDFAYSEKMPIDVTRNTNWFYFLNTIDVLTEESNKAVICYGDSITAQSWPDYLTLKLKNEGINNVSIIRRAVSGTRVLRQYDCTTYAAYGLKGETRFPREIETSGAVAVIIQHGINDIIHPVGEDVNPFRPMSDLPTSSELSDAIESIYIREAKHHGLKIYLGTLLPINGWRTYAPFREVLRDEFNSWIRHTMYGRVDGIIDFDRAVCDKDDSSKFGPDMDSGDHLHPSEKAYSVMADTAYAVLSDKTNQGVI